MLGSNDPGEWRRVVKAMVEAVDPAVAVRIGRGDPTGHHPVRLTLNGCRETLRLYEDQVAALAADETARASVQQEVKEAVALLQLKAEIIRVLQEGHPRRRVTLQGPVPLPGGGVSVEIKGGVGSPAMAARGRTYGEALRHLHQQLVGDPMRGR